MDVCHGTEAEGRVLVLPDGCEWGYDEDGKVNALIRKEGEWGDMVRTRVWLARASKALCKGEMDVQVALTADALAIQAERLHIRPPEGHEWGWDLLCALVAIKVRKQT